MYCKYVVLRHGCRQHLKVMACDTPRKKNSVCRNKSQDKENKLKRPLRRNPNFFAKHSHFDLFFKSYHLTYLMTKNSLAFLQTFIPCLIRSHQKKPYQTKPHSETGLLLPEKGFTLFPPPPQIYTQTCPPPPNAFFIQGFLIQVYIRETRN